jgi:hypothetical protein
MVHTDMSPVPDPSNALPPYPADSRCPRFTLPQGVRATLLSLGDNLYLGLAKGNPK